MPQNFILAAIPVVVRKTTDGKIQVHTQTRHVINPEWDGYYDGTEESCGESMEANETIIETAIRGCQEELGAPVLKPVIIGDKGAIFTTHNKGDKGKEDRILGLQPYYFVQQLIGPQQWIGVVFVVVVPPGFEPKQDAEGETSAHQWWDPENLGKELILNPRKFQGLDYPALLKVCQDLKNRQLVIP